MANRDFEIRMRMEAEYSAAQKALRDTEKELKRLQDTARKLDADLGKIGGDRISAPMDSAARAMKGAALSGKQLQAATRQLPMQFTDIFTSLQAGQSPMQVFLQQGGQLKDVFGGVGPAARAMGGYIAGLINPLTIAAALAGALAIAWHQAEQRTVAFNKALVLTGNRIGSSTEELRAMAAELDAIEGVTEGGASAALAEIAASGKFTAEQFDLVGEAAVRMKAVTGQSVEDTIDNFARIAADPVDALLKLNKTEHFLTRTQLDRVQALIDEGREQEAATEAVRIYADTVNRRARELEGNLGLVAGAWKDIKSSAAEAWDEMVTGIGRADIAAREFVESLGGLEPNIKAMIRKAGVAMAGLSPLLSGALLAAGSVSPFAGVTASVSTTATTEAAVDSEAEERRLKAIEEFDRIALSNLDKSKKLKNEIAKIEELGLAAGKSRAEIEEQIAAARARYAASLPKAPKGPKGTDPNATAARALATLQKQLALLGELEAGEKKASEAARVRYEITEGAYRNASQGLKDQLIATAQLVDTERNRQQLAKELSAVNLEKVRLQGQGAAAGIAEAVTKLEELRTKLNAIGNAAGVADVTEVIGLTRARAQLDEFGRQYDAVMGDIAREQERIQTLVQTGLISEYEAQDRIVKLYREKGTVIESLLPKMEAMAQQLGDPAAIAGVQRIRAELEKMQATTSLLQQQIGQTFTGAFSNALASLATNTATLGEAVNGFLLDMADGLARMASEAIAQEAWARLLSLFQSDTGGGGEQGAAAAQTAAAAATGAAAAALSGAGGVVTAGATAITGSAAALVGAGGTLATGAVAVTAAAAALQAAATTMLVANSMGGFATGGYTGAGGKYDLAGYVHRGEYVMPKETVQHYGLGLMRAIHHGTMPADRFAGASRPRVAVPTRPAYSFAEGGLATGGLPTIENRFRFINLVDPTDIGNRYAQSPDFEREVLNVIGRNPTTIGAGGS